MENKSLKKYKYKFNKSFYAIAIIGTVVAIACLVLNLIRFIKLNEKDIVPGFYEYVSLVLSVVLSIAFLIFVVSSFINSYYAIEDVGVILKWGVIKNTIKASDIKQIKLITDTDSLELVFEDESYFLIAINKSEQELFINELKQKYNSVVFIQETSSPNDK